MCTKTRFWRYFYAEFTSMKFNHMMAAGMLLLTTTTNAQTTNGKKEKFFSFHATMSDYQTPRDISNNALKGSEWLKPGNKSFGLGATYWRGLSSHADFSVGLTGTFSNFPAGFVKNDTVGQAKFSTQLDALLHLRMFAEKATVNPFLTAGLGAGYFPGQLAFYAPLGTGLQFRFNDGAYLFLQAQWRTRLSSGIQNDYLHYSLGFAQAGSRKKKTEEPLPLPQEVTPMIPDKDGDGFADAQDQCPELSGTVKGCPDSDGDGVADKNDACPADKGTLNGCPDKDNDEVADKDDKCPDVAGVKRYGGCPVPDSDGDGMDDENDQCPQTAGVPQNSGCPEIKEDVKKKKEFPARNIYFRFASDYILQVSYKALDEVAAIMMDDADLNLIIEAHADNRGLPERNMMWSERRAKAVADYFIRKGIDAGRIIYKGYGDTRPVADNSTEKGRAQNRRVEMKVGY